MNDAKEYSVKYDGTEVKFTATDGVVADVALDKITIVKGSAGSVVKAQFLDKTILLLKNLLFQMLRVREVLITALLKTKVIQTVISLCY